MIKKLFFASAMIISAAFAFVACSSDDDNNDNKSSLAKTSWTLEVDNPENPMSISIVSEQEGYICSSFKTSDDEGKEYKFETRTKFTYQKEGEKYKMIVKAIATEYDGKWETSDIDGADYPAYFTVNEQAKTMTFTYGDNEKVTFKQADYAPISWPESTPFEDEAKTKDDVLGEWIGGMVFPYPMMMGACKISFTKKGDVYSATGRTYLNDKTRGKVLYDVSFKDCSYTVDNGKVEINVSEDTKIVMKTKRNMGGDVDVYKNGKIQWLPCFVIHTWL